MDLIFTNNTLLDRLPFALIGVAFECVEIGEVCLSNVNICK